MKHKAKILRKSSVQILLPDKMLTHYKKCLMKSSYTDKQGKICFIFRDSGICSIREELHRQCFDEIIRQVTIDSPERGMLLMRVRDELYMTI